MEQKYFLAANGAVFGPYATFEAAYADSANQVGEGEQAVIFPVAAQSITTPPLS